MNRDEVWVGTDPIDIARVAASVHDEALGGVGMFLGRVRSPNGGHVIHHLDYEGYEDMILATMSAIADELRAEHGGDAERMLVAIYHRLGRLLPGEVSLAVAIATPHRATALAACAAAVEKLKRRLPVWKQEVDDAGSRYVTGTSVAGEVL